MPLSTVLRHHPASRPISTKTAKLIVCLVGVMVAALDFVTPAEYDVGVFYGLGIAICAWSDSRKVLWTATSLFIGLIFVGAAVGAAPHTPWTIVWVNRSLTAVALLVIAALVHQWMGNLTAVEGHQNLTKRLLQTLDLAQVIVRKLDGTILFWSHGAELLYGWTAEEAAGRITHELFSSQLDGETIGDISRQLEREGQWVGELHHIRKDGTPIWVASQWTIHTSGLFQFPVVIEVNNDVTELKFAENRFRHLTEVLPHLVWQLAEDGRTTYVNQRWRDYFGLGPNAVTLAERSQFIHPDDVAQSVTRWEKAWQTGQIEPWEARYRRHDGVYRWFEGRAVPVRNEAGKILHWIGTATDVEDQKKMSERLRETQKLESIGRLAGGVAHDFNNLLTAISGYNSFLGEEVEGNKTAEGYSLEIQKAADRAAALTRQLLSFSRPQLTKPKLINLNHIITDISKILRRVIGEDVNLELRLAPELPNILADPIQLDQIVMNLAVNARDAMPDGGTLEIRTGTTEVREDEAHMRQVSAGLHVTLTARDTGTGMDEETKARLFEPFFTTKERGKGTGLGLSIVFGVVKHSGGYITVESAAGAGAEFTIALPASTGAESVQLTTPSEKVANTGGTIMVVEDETTVRSLVRESLRKRGYRVLEASMPSAALKLISEFGSQIDLLISDVLMPEMRGPELVASIRKLRPDLAVLYMSGYSDSSFLDPTVLEGAFYIQKPFQPDELAEMVAKILQKGLGD